MPPEAPIAFFSYSRDDSDFALRLAQDLKAAGANVWIDQLDIQPGQEWDSAIEAAVTQSPRMLLILSPASVKSRNVRNEISFALDANKTIIPVLYQDCTVPLQLHRIQYIDLRTAYSRGVDVLLRTLGVDQRHAAGAKAAMTAADLAEPQAGEQRAREAARQRLQQEEQQRVDAARRERERLEAEREKAKAAPRQARPEAGRKLAAEPAAPAPSNSPEESTSDHMEWKLKDILEVTGDASDGSPWRMSAVRASMIGLVTCIVVAVVVYFALRKSPIVTTPIVPPNPSASTSPSSTPDGGSGTLTKPSGEVVGGSIKSTPKPQKANLPHKLIVSAGVAESYVISKVEPLYPQVARIAHVQGDVVLQVLISPQGTVESIRVISGHPVLIQAAMDAVKQWRYKPYFLNNEPVGMETVVKISFHM